MGAESQDGWIAFAGEAVRLGALSQAAAKLDTCLSAGYAVCEDRETRVNATIDDALRFLHSTMRRGAEDDLDLGFWTDASPITPAATAILAFEVQGHQADGDPGTDPYVETVQRGLNYLLDQMQSQPIGTQPAGDSDTDGNGPGLFAASNAGTVMYEVGIVAMALAGSGTPDAKARSRNADVDGRTHPQIAQDLVDFMAWAQADTNSGTARGGWGYKANSCDADMSVSQWPVLGMQAAENNWCAQVPSWVKSELRDHFLTSMQGGDGGFGYTSRGTGNVAWTAAGLVGLAFSGVSSRREPVRQASCSIDLASSAAVALSLDTLSVDRRACMLVAEATAGAARAGRLPAQATPGRGLRASNHA